MSLYRCDWRSRAVFRWPLGAMVRCLCSGLTRDGARCKITSDSKVKDKHGRLASLPLQLGGEFCLFHARVLHELAFPDGRVDFALFYIDLETDGLRSLKSSPNVRISASPRKNSGFLQENRIGL